MTHLDDDRLLLLAYGELPEAEAADMDAYLAECAPCRARFERLERARVALGWSVPQHPRAPRWIAAGLAAAALATVLFWVSRADGDRERAWNPPSAWSATAGYIAGGTTVLEIDAQLTRLEQERYYGLPD